MGRRPQLVRRLKEHIAAQTSSHRSSSASCTESPSSEEHNGDSSAPSPDSRPRSGTETESGRAGHLRDRSSSSPSTGTSRSSSVSTSPAERSRRHISNTDRRHKRHRRPSLRQRCSSRMAKERHQPHSPVRRVRRDQTRSRCPLYQHLYKRRRDRRSLSSRTSHAHAWGSLRRHSRRKGSRRYNPSRHRRLVHDRLGPTPSPPSSSDSDSDSGSEWDEDTPPSACGQPLQRSTLRAIRRDEFINLSLLLTHPPQLDPDLTGRVPLATTDMGRQPQRRTSLQITNLDTWLRAWSRYLLATVHYHPRKAIQMIAYQDRIVAAAERYHFEGLYNYDRAFRLKLSHNPSLRWDSLDQELWALWCTLHAKPFCAKCYKYGHSAAACPVGNRSSFRTNNRTKDGRTICLQFNHSACPNATKCKYAHVCLKCEGEHPSSSGACSGHTT